MTLNRSRSCGDLSAQHLVLLQFLLIRLRGLLRLRRELIVMDLELLVKLLDLTNQNELHSFELLDIAVFCLFSERVVLGHHLLQFGVFFILDGVDHLGKLLSLEFVPFFNVVTLLVVLSLDDLNIAEELLMETAES